MRPIRLELTAFGPFAGHEVVDFAGLSAAGLFLVHGDTGAGKTSVLDALCFALYGCVPGVRDRGREVRSDHAAPTQLTSVQLDFEIGGGQFRIWRQPKQLARKLRGEGHTVHQPKVVLFRGPSLELVSNRLDEAGLAMQDLLGMTAEQFCQVVLLPQGEFAKFLRADAKDRQDLLENLFAAARYRTIESLLADDKTTAAARLRELETRADRLLHQCASEAQLESPPDGAAAPWVAELTMGIHASADQARAAARDAQAAETTARARCESALAAAAAQARLVSARARHAVLTAQGPAYAARLDELHAARRAAPVVPQCVRAAASAAAVAELRERGPQVTDVAALVDREQSLTERVARLTGCLPAERELAAAVAESGELQRRILRSVAERAEAAAALTAMRELLDESAIVALAGSAAAAALQSAMADVARLQDQYAAARALIGLRQQLLVARERQVALDAAVNRARTHQLQLLERRLDGMAGELATVLRPGEPCAVCGSAEHPAPATGGVSVTVDQLEQAEAAGESAGNAADAGRRVVEGLVFQQSARETTAAGLDVDQVSTLLSQATALVAELHDNVQRAEATAPMVAALEVDAKARAERIAVLDRELAVAHGRAGALIDVIADRDAVVESAREGFESVAARLADVESALRQVSSSRALAEELARA
ncbi:MAG: AAA family ATPase, partial [Mycobacteriales bacterium]